MQKLHTNGKRMYCTTFCEKQIVFSSRGVGSVMSTCDNCPIAAAIACGQGLTYISTAILTGTGIILLLILSSERLLCQRGLEGIIAHVALS